jgi:hypothetical protein
MKADDVRQPGKGLNVAVAHPETATGQQVVSEESIILGDCHKSEAVRENIHIVQRRDGEGDFEFPREIGFAVERIHT